MQNSGHLSANRWRKHFAQTKINFPGLEMQQLMLEPQQFMLSQRK